MIIGIAGLIVSPDGVPLGTAGAGKDTVAGFLTKRSNYVKVALADPLKRICMDAYDFTYEQLWGPNELRNAPDKRYPRLHPHHDIHAIDASEQRFRCSRCELVTDANGSPHLPEMCTDYLTPREALQKLGTEWGRKLYPDTWVAKMLRTALAIMQEKREYIDCKGLGSERQYSYAGVAVSDVRFRNEIDAIRKTGGKLVRVKRPGQPLKGAAALHKSETESLEIPDEEFDYILENTSSLDNLEQHTLRMLSIFGRRIIPYDAAQADIPPFKRR